ncbi:MAG: head-tail adaptor protein [Deltaproteobacteria bacterium]|nr:head-tail adaptor protein [Deltaproteobacteria bacterium]
MGSKSHHVTRKHHVKFYTIETVEDGMGGETENDILFHSCLAELIPQTKEVVENMKVNVFSIMKVNIPFRKDILSTMKMEHVKTSMMYEIIGDPINREMANRSLDIVVKEIKK